VSLVFTLEKGDVVGAQFFHARKQLFRSGCLLFVVWIASIAADYFYDLQDMYLLTYGVPFFVAVLLLFQKRSIDRYIASDKTLLKEVEVSWSAAGMVYATSQSRLVYPWDQLFRWAENDRLLLVYVSSHSFMILPKKAFLDPGSLADLRLQLIERQVKGPRGATA